MLSLICGKFFNEFINFPKFRNNDIVMLHADISNAFSNIYKKEKKVSIVISHYESPYL